jgi:hypothetical protein
MSNLTNCPGLAPRKARLDPFHRIGSQTALAIYDAAAVLSDEDIDRYLRPIVAVLVVWLNQRTGVVGRARSGLGVMPSRRTANTST